MPAPSLTLSHLKTSRQHEGATLINRYWFQWSNRKNLTAQVVRVELLDDAGQVLTKGSVQLPKVKRTGGPVWFHLDDIPREPPTQLRYYTVNLLSKSEAVTAPMAGQFDDLSSML